MQGSKIGMGTTSARWIPLIAGIRKNVVIHSAQVTSLPWTSSPAPHKRALNNPALQSLIYIYFQ